MASSSHLQGNDDLNFTANSPCFFKIILEETIDNGKLGIPRKFVKEHGTGMSSPAILRVSSGEEWKVELTKCDGVIWFEKGWPQFASQYSLELGHLLVFRYIGNNNFHVTIFDRSATEIQYSHTSNNQRPNRKVREKSQSQSPSPQPHKMMRSTNSAVTTETETETEYNENNDLSAQQGSAARKDDENNDALERARNTFQSEYPFFLLVIRQSYVCRLTMPTNFVREHLMKEHCSVTLCNSSGKTWIVNYSKKHIKKQLISHLQNGWGTFVHDNNIKVGYVCAFELINSIEVSFKVHIYNGSSWVCPEKPQSPCLRPHKIMRSSNTTIETELNEQSGCAAQSVRYNEKAKAVERDGNNSFKPENPSFVIVMQSSHVGQDQGRNYRLAIPCNFAEKHITKEDCSVILCSSGETWIAEHKQARVGNGLYSFLQAGWRTFVRDNNIQLGDVCSFELINSIELSFNVVIEKGQHEKNCHQSASTDVFGRVKRSAQLCATASPSFPEQLSDLKKAKGFQVDGASKSEDPSFVVVLKPSYVNSNRLGIPAGFARQYLSNMHQEVILLLLNGKSWPVRYYQHCANIEGPKPNTIFGNGWGKFAVDNNLEVGDVCRFELTKGDEASMNVTITKKKAVVEDADFGSSADDGSREKQGELHETASMKEKGDM